MHHWVGGDINVLLGSNKGNSPIPGAAAGRAERPVGASRPSPASRTGRIGGPNQEWAALRGITRGIKEKFSIHALSRGIRKGFAVRKKLLLDRLLFSTA